MACVSLFSAAMKRHLPLIFLFLLLVVFRVLGGMGLLPVNFSPLAAFILLSYAAAERRGLMVALAAWLVTDPVLNVLQGGEFLSWDQLGILLGLAVLLPVASWVKADFGWKRGLLGCVMAAVLFYVSTNVVSFFSLPGLYAKNGEGFLQAMWTGPAGFSPTWIFLRNSLAGNVLFGTVFLLARVRFSLYSPASVAAKAA